jgi:hypothetical protein
MKKPLMIALGLTLGLALAPSLAMAAPDFSGTWVRDKAKSSPEPYPLYWLTRSQPGGFGGNQDPVMQVKQTASGLQVVDPVHPQRSYALDGRPHTVTMDTGMRQASVTAAVQSDALTIASSEPYGGMPGNVTANARETWRLSADGKVLTITTVVETPAKQQSFTEVYNRR